MLVAEGTPMTPEEQKRVDEEVAAGFQRLGLPLDSLASTVGSPVLPELPAVNQSFEAPAAKVQFVLRSTST